MCTEKHLREFCREAVDNPARQLIYNDDGWSSYMRYPAPMSPDDVVRATVGAVADTAVSVYQFCALGGHAVNYRSRFLPVVGQSLDTCDTMHVLRMRETLRWLAEHGTDPLRIVSEVCHDHGLACQFSLRMNDRHHTYRLPDGRWYFPELQSPWLAAHPELLLPDGALDYARPEVHAYRLRQLTEVLDSYEVDGLDLDFTRFRPWFRPGAESAGAPLMTDLVRRLRDLTAPRGKTLSARFEYDPKVCLASGLAVDHWLREGLLDQITLGGVGDHTPDAPCDWWVAQSRLSGCRVFPGVEGQLHWVVSSGGGGQGLRPGNGVEDGFGPPSLPYLRAVALNHYASGADGISLFNFTCADGPFDRAMLTELADPGRMAAGDKQYVATLWPWDAQIYGNEWWESRWRLRPGETEARYTLRVADDTRHPRFADCRAVLRLDLKGLNHHDDVTVLVGGQPVAWNGYHYNHYDHGCWNDILGFDVPVGALRQGGNELCLRRERHYAGFSGSIEVRRCVLEICYSHTFAPGRLVSPDATTPEADHDR
ncbi:MAG: hypothetical protein HPY69_04085 [Armatimonadetes bacterium]|nr:hypothetical protein [Armatimonadota bacterium]